MAVTHSPRASLGYNSQLTVTGSLPARHTAGSEAQTQSATGPRDRRPPVPRDKRPRAHSQGALGPRDRGPGAQRRPRDRSPGAKRQRPQGQGTGGPGTGGPGAKTQGATGPGDPHPAGEGYLTLTLTWLVCNDHQCMDDNIYTLYVGMHFIH